MRWGVWLASLAAGCATSAAHETRARPVDNLTYFSGQDQNGQLTFNDETPVTIEVGSQIGSMLVDNTAPFAILVRASERGNQYHTISFYGLPAGRIIAYRNGSYFPAWAENKSCPALDDLARSIAKAATPPPRSPDEDRVICTADCTHYGLMLNQGSGADFAPGDQIDNDNVWRVFQQASDLPCWRKEIRE